MFFENQVVAAADEALVIRRMGMAKAAGFARGAGAGNRLLLSQMYLKVPLGAGHIKVNPKFGHTFF